uniref:Uncharacterized protein n=1 Tax=Arundo donax TaxID=35708 RepID=A0A0A9BT17_ARUDO
MCYTGTSICSSNQNAVIQKRSLL